MKINWKWPSSPKNSFSPGYVIIWRLPWFFIGYFGRCVVCFSVLMAFGPTVGKRYWEQSDSVY